MNHTRTWSRRTWLKTSLAAAWAGGAALALPEDCRPTVYKGDGPFYPRQPIPSAFDLTQVPGKQGRAAGDTLYVFGRILDEQCRPVAGARVEIWQADPNGRYRHERATGKTPLDPNFHYFGYVIANERGEYLFKTIRPGKYSFGSLRRAPHIHFKVKSANHRLLSSEMYFAGDEKLMAGDPVFLEAPEADRTALIVAPQSPSAFAGKGVDFDADALCCPFDLTLRV